MGNTTKNKIKAVTKTEGKRSPKQDRRPKQNVVQKYLMQTSQQGLLDRELDAVSESDDDLFQIESSSSAEDFILDQEEQIIDYFSDEVDGDVEDDACDSVFDSLEEKVLPIKPDIIFQEVMPFQPYEKTQPNHIDVSIPLMKFTLRKGVSKDVLDRADALQQIGNIIAGKDKEFLLAYQYDLSLISHKVQKDMARIIGKHETWITNLKEACIVETSRWGVLPLSLFFPEEPSSDVKKFSKSIQSHIFNENPLAPLTIEDLASLISHNETTYKSLVSNAGSKLRRILSKLAIPSPKERKDLAEVIINLIQPHGTTDAEINHALNNYKDKQIAELTIVCKDYVTYIVHKLKERKLNEDRG